MTQNLKRRGILFCIVGPAGSGKTSLSDQLRAQVGPGLKVSVSVTTRAPRQAEVEGESYYFVSDYAFDKLIEEGQFVEWEQVHGFRYGTLSRTMKEAVEAGQDLLLRIDIRGASNLKKIHPRDTVIIFLVPPQFAELENRLSARAKVDSEELKLRLQTAKEELALLVSELHSELVDYVLVNDKFDRSLEMLLAILKSERIRAERVLVESLRHLCQ